MNGLLVGRDAECAALRGCLTSAGAAPAVFVAGEAGAGKTTLVEHVLASTGMPVLRGRAAGWASPAYDVLARALRPAVRTASEPVGGPLAQILPELGAAPREPEPAALAVAVCAVLTGAAGGHPAVLFLDDLHWADDDTLGFLPVLADTASSLPVTVVGCYRSDELPRGHHLRAARALLRRNRQLTEIGLGQLGDGDVNRMLAALLGADPDPSLATAVTSRADGLPFAVEELAFALRDSGRLSYAAGRVSLSGQGDAPVPDGIRDAVLLRVARLTGEERALLETAAVAGGEFGLDTVLAASGVAAWPDGFTGSGLLAEAQEGSASFRHPLTREAAYDGIPWPRRRRLHRALAAAITGQGGAPAAAAVHLLAAKDFPQARPVLLAAARDHCAVHAYRAAARALRSALAHWPPGEDPGRRLAAVDLLARCAERCSQYDDAVALLREVAAGHRRCGGTRELAGAQRRLALAHELQGQWESALAAREAAAVAFCAAGLPSEAAVDRLAVATHLRSAASYSAALATLDVAEADARAGGRADLRLRAEGLRGNVLARLGQAGRGIAAVRSALDRALAGSHLAVAAELQQRLADSLEHSGDFHAAALAYGAAYQYCDTHDAGVVGQLCRACATVVLFGRGDWDRVAGICEDVLASASLAHPRAVGAGVLGLVHAFRGAAGPARRHLLDSQVAATRIELTAMELLSAWGLCVLADAAGADGEAADRARQILARLARSQERHYAIPVLQWAATFFASQGLASDVQACASALSEIAEASPQPEAVAALAHARGETLLPGEPAAAARELSVAAEMFAGLGLPLATAQAQRRAAAAAARLGEDARARDLLQAAHARAGRLGARRLRDDCAAELRRLGGKPGGRAVPGRAPTSLTSRELDVMHLVARGNTSRQIGAALFISPRTVEMHVQNSLLKLGCRTRAQAVRRLSELGALPAAQGS